MGVLASLGFGWLRPQRVEAYLGLGVGILVVVLGLWMLWTQRDLLAVAMKAPNGTFIKRLLSINQTEQTGACAWATAPPRTASTADTARNDAISCSFRPGLVICFLP